MIKITRNNDFTLRLAAYCMVEGERVDIDLREVDIDTVTLPGAPEGALTWQVDEDGRLLLDIDGPRLDVRGYGLAVTGTIGGRDWHWAVRRIFEVVRYTADSNTTDEATIEALCEPTGITVETLAAKAMTKAEWDALEYKDEKTVYFIID